MVGIVPHVMVSSNLAATNYHAAQIINCKTLDTKYQVFTTVKQKKAYADCINFLYPDKGLSDSFIGTSCLIFILLGAALAWAHVSDKTMPFITMVCVSCVGGTFGFMLFLAAWFFYQLFRIIIGG